MQGQECLIYLAIEKARKIGGVGSENLGCPLQRTYSLALTRADLQTYRSSNWTAVLTKANSSDLQSSPANLRHGFVNLQVLLIDSLAPRIEQTDKPGVLRTQRRRDSDKRSYKSSPTAGEEGARTFKGRKGWGKPTVCSMKKTDVVPNLRTTR